MARFLGDNARNEEENSPHNYNIIASGTKIVGKLNVESDFRLDGEVEGDIIGKSKVIIGEKGYLKGTLTCENAEILGKVTGNLNIKKTLTLRSTAVLNGDVKIHSLVIEPNAVYNGSCSMNNDKNDLNENSSKNKEIKK